MNGERKKHTQKILKPVSNTQRECPLLAFTLSAHFVIRRPGFVSRWRHL